MRSAFAKPRRLAIKSLVWVVALTPAVRMVWQGLNGNLGANPIEAVLHQTGWWGLLLLAVTLAISPIRRLTGWHSIIRFRRLIGLFAFFYATLHFVAYVGLDQAFEFEFILEDIVERPFITVGVAAWLVLLALAATSTRGLIQRLGRNWRRLHRLVYLAAGLGVLHFFWKEKADTLEPLLFAAGIALLLLLRLPLRPESFPRTRYRQGPVGRPTVRT